MKQVYFLPALVIGHAWLLAANLCALETLSVEWLVDSSDAILQVQVGRTDTDPLSLRVVSMDPIKTRRGSKPISDVKANFYRLRSSEDGTSRLEFRFYDQTRWITAGSKADQPTDWMLFFRADESDWRFIHALNLSRPKEMSRYAAFTADGTVLDDKNKIIQYVRDRILLSRELPDNCRREVIDRWGERLRGVLNWYECTRFEDYYLSTERISEIQGGFPLEVSSEISVSDWDSPDQEELDYGYALTSVIVPADAKYQKRLIAQLNTSRSATDGTVLALSNYSGDETERILERTTQSRTTLSLVAERLLYHLRYRRNPAHALDTKLVGRWILDGSNETVHLTLRQDHSSIINTRPTEATRKSRLEMYRPVDGIGYWAIRDGKLWIGRSHILRGGKWSVARREFFPPKKMLQIKADQVILEGGPPMKRVKQ